MPDLLKLALGFENIGTAAQWPVSTSDIRSEPGRVDFRRSLLGLASP